MPPVVLLLLDQVGDTRLQQHVVVVVVGVWEERLMIEKGPEERRKVIFELQMLW